MRWLFLVAGVVACRDATPTCDELERKVAAIAKASNDDVRERARESRVPIHNEFLPLFGDHARELGERCRKKTLSAEAMRCLQAARTGADLDRCSANHRP